MSVQYTVWNFHNGMELSDTNANRWFASSSKASLRKGYATVARHVVDTHLEVSFLESNDIL